LRLIVISKPKALTKAADKIVEERARSMLRESRTNRRAPYHDWMRTQFGSPLQYRIRFLAGYLAHRAQMDGRGWAQWDVQRLAEQFPDILNDRTERLPIEPFLPPIMERPTLMTA